MDTSRNIMLSEPSGTDQIPMADFGYMRSRNRHRLYSLVIEEFKKSGFSQADLARRLGKNPDVVCRWLAAPRNWQIDTISDLLFAISGAEAAYDVRYPLKHAPLNSTWLDWLIDDTSKGQFVDEFRKPIETYSSHTRLQILTDT